MPLAAHSGAVCLNENFDGVTAPALPSGWTSSMAAGAGSDIGWTTRAVGYNGSAPNAAWIDDYNDYADISLVSRTYGVAATGTPSVSFHHSYLLWAPDASPLYNGVYNGAVLEISINGGAFTDLVAAGGSFTAGAYKVSFDPGFDNALAQTAPFSRSVWGGSSAGFITTTAILPPAALGGAVQFRWRLGTEGGGRSFDSYSGWWLDDFEYGALGDAIFVNGFDATSPCF